MGMFDNLVCRRKINGVYYNDIDFQTKSMDNFLDMYLIEEDGKLYKFEFEWEESKEEEKPKKKDKKGIHALDSFWNRKRINERYEPYFFHGDIYFYGSTIYDAHDLDLNFIARYNAGDFIGIFPATENGQIIYKSKDNIEFLAMKELTSYDSEFLKENKKHVNHYLIETDSNKILNFLGIKKYTTMQGIKLDIYKEWRKKKDLEWQEYYKKNPIVSYKETIKKKPKKKVKKK